MPTKSKTWHEQLFAFEPGRGSMTNRAPGLPPECEVAPPLTTRRDEWSADAAPALAPGVGLPRSARLEAARPVGRGRAA